MYSLNNVVTKLVQQQRRHVRPQVLSDKGDLFGSLDAFNYLLRSPSSVFVDANHSQVRSDTFEHRKPGTRRTLLKELLYDL